MATDRLSLLLESKTIGLEDVLRMEKALNRVLEQGQKARATGDGVAAATRNASGATQQFGQNIGQFIRDPLGTAATAAEGFITKLGPMGIGMAAVGTAAVASGLKLFDLVTAAGASAKAIENLSLITGLSVRQVQELDAAARVSGLSIDLFADANKKLSKVLTDTSGEAQQVRQTLRALGVDFFDANGQLKGTEQIFLGLADAFNRIESPAKRAALAQQVFEESGVKLLAVFPRLRENVEFFRSNGLGIDEATSKGVLATTDALARLSVLYDDIAKKARAFLAEAVSPVVGFLSQPFGSASDSGPRVSVNGASVRDPGRINTASGFTVSTAAGGLIGAALGAPSLDSQRTRLSTLQGQIEQSRQKLAELQGKLDLDPAAAEREIGNLRRLQSEYRNTETAIKAAEKAKSEFERLNALGTFTVPDQFFAFGARRTPSLARGGTIEQNPFAFRLEDRGGAAIQVTERSIQEANSGAEAAAIARTKAILEGTRSADEQAKRLRVESIQQALAFESERLSLLTGPGGELATVKAITKLRLDAVEQEFAITGNLRAADEARLRIFRERALEELRVVKERDDRNRQTGGQVFDALLAGGGGVRRFVSGLGLGFGRTAFGNLFSEIARGTTGALQLPGQTGADGRPNFLGRVLSGTPFGLDPQKVALDANTLATQANTAALLGGRAGGAIGGSLGSIFGAPSSVFGGAGSNPFIFSTTGGGTRSPVPFAGITGADGLPIGIVGGGVLIPQVKGPLSTGQKVGAAAAIAGGGFLVKSGIQQGGVAGALDAGAGGASALAALLPLLGVTGPAAPILIGSALAAQVVKNFLPDPRKARAATIDQLVNASRVDFGDVTGIDTDFARGGSLASTKGGIVVIQNINAADAKSFLDRRDDIAAAISQSIEEGNSRLREGITRTVDLGPV